MSLYTLTEEHRAQFPAWRDRWIANAMLTEAMTDADRAKCIDAVNGMYRAANLAPPKHIVFVPSPFVMAFAGGFAAARWHLSKTGAQKAAIEATRAATDAATYAATYAATDAATDAATRAATDAATDAASRDYSRWYVVPGDMRACAEDLGVGDFGLRCAAMVHRIWSGGNQWSAWDSYVTFFQDVAKLPLDYSAYNHWRVLAEHSGPRIVHPDFCMISDRPAILKVDDQNQPHCEDGPFCEWRMAHSFTPGTVPDCPPAGYANGRLSIPPRSCAKEMLKSKLPGPPASVGRACSPRSTARSSMPIPTPRTAS